MLRTLPALAATLAVSLLLFRLHINTTALHESLQYQGTAIVGNCRLLVPIDGFGTIIGAFWPHTGMHENIRNSHKWVIEGATPPCTGAFLGIQYPDGRTVWLRDCEVQEQVYRERSNILQTTYSLPDGRRVTVEDWVLPEEDVLVRRVHIAPVGDLRLIAFQNLDLGGEKSSDHAEMRGGLILQWRSRPRVAVAVGSSAAPRELHISSPDLFPAVRRGELNGRSRGSGDVISAAAWPIDRALTVVYAFAGAGTPAADAARRALSRDVEELRNEASASEARWLASGSQFRVSDERIARLYERSLLVLKLLQDSDTGGIIGGARSFWSFCWPRDGVVCAAAFDAAGHHREAERLYRFLAGAQRPDGMWEARYRSDGSAVLDGRAVQIDAAGYFPWGVWMHLRTTGDRRFAGEMYPCVRRSAECVLAHMDGVTGLPGPSPDYWEYSKRPGFHLSNAVICWGGLTCAADLASVLGRSPDARRYREAAGAIEAGIRTHLWDEKKRSYVRGLKGHRGADSAACWAVFPFGIFSPDDERMRSTVERIESRLTTARGGITPGEDWRKPDPWVHETSFLLHYYLACGNEEKADEYFGWMLGAATDAFTLPETISVRTGLPNSTTPLGWSHANLILAVVERWGGGVPVPGRDQAFRAPASSISALTIMKSGGAR